MSLCMHLDEILTYKIDISVKECIEEEMAEKGNFEGSGKGKKAKVEVPDILEKGGEPAAAGAAENGEEKHALENGVSVYLTLRSKCR